jgi:hypothetical protein
MEGLVMLGLARIAQSHRSPGDPYWANVAALLHFNGADGSKSFVDQVPKLWTPSGSATLSVAQQKFGESSMYQSGASGSKVTTTDPIMGLSGQDYTIEAWVYAQASSASSCIFSNFTTQSFGRIYFYVAPAGALRLIEQDASGANQASLVSAGTFPLEEWVHCAATKSGTTIRMFINGALQDSATSKARTFGTGVKLGSFDSGAFEYVWKGYIDDFRLTRGVARYTGNFTPPVAPFPNHS